MLKYIPQHPVLDHSQPTTCVSQSYIVGGGGWRKPTFRLVQQKYESVVFTISCAGVISYLLSYWKKMISMRIPSTNVCRS